MTGTMTLEDCPSSEVESDWLKHRAGLGAHSRTVVGHPDIRDILFLEWDFLFPTYLRDHTLCDRDVIEAPAVA
jgi:hypothetical protein